jgi:hypothetical protein
MAQKRKGTDPQYEETTAPQNPPNSMLEPRARTGWLARSLGTLLVIFVVIGAVFGWVLVRHELGKDARLFPDPQAVGTSGPEQSPGGFNPTPDRSSTRDELKFRGAQAPEKEPGTGLTAKELSEKK